MDIVDEHKSNRTMKAHSSDDMLPEHPPALKFALQLTFAMLSHVLRWLTHKSSQYARSNINPYHTVLLACLATVLKHWPPLNVLECTVPWEELATIFATIPWKIMISQGLMGEPGKPNSHHNIEGWVILTSSCPSSLVEDWCLRRMEWINHKVYEHGFWKSGKNLKAEIEVLEAAEGGQLTDGMIEDDGDECTHRSSAGSRNNDDDDGCGYSSSSNDDNDASSSSCNQDDDDDDGGYNSQP